MVKTKTYYFSDKLKRRLALMHGSPLTVVEAPSGFGKTTAVREYLRENLPEGAWQYWYTCLGEPASAAWTSICQLLANADEDTAANLKKLELPTLDTLIHLLEILQNFHCMTETYLVIDNYHLMHSDIPRELMSVFSMHGSPNLHMIFITQQLGTRQKSTVHNDNIHTIDSSAFFFDKEGTDRLFRMEGIRLSDDELNRIYASTEGWVSAIRLQIISYKEIGSFEHAVDIEHLVQAAIWNGLTADEKNLLLSVSVMDSFTARQAAIMMGKDVLPEDMEEMLVYNDFIRYFPDKGVYVIHSILQEFLRNRFYHHQPLEYQNRMFRLAGRSFAAISQYFPAAQFFFKIGDFDAILALPFSGEYLGNQKENNLLEFLAAVVEECPEETLCKYPFAMLMLSSQMFLCAELDKYRKLRRLIGTVIEEDKNLSQEDHRRLWGELEKIKAFEAYNDIKNMGEAHRAAWEILRQPSMQAKMDVPFTFGCTSVLYLHWRDPGDLEKELRDLDEYLPVYLKLTQGHGCGANSVMRAEAMLMRGEDDEAEILCHKAIYAARSYQQTSVCLCAELVLARIAILRGDAESYLTIIKNIQDYARDNSNLYVLRMVDLCMSAINLILGNTQSIPKWLCDMQSIRKTLYAPAIPYAQTLFSMLLLLEKRYKELLGISQLILDAADGGMGNARYMMSRVYHLKYLAITKLNSGNVREAQQHLNEALSIVLPDKVYLPLAQQSGTFFTLLEAAKNTFADKEGINALMALCKRQEKGVNAINKAIRSAKSPLTTREREVALLARDRLSAREIAQRLFISEATVKTILKNAYSKLSIHSKSELHSMEF